MLEAPIPKDIRKYDAKLVGPFTTRQLFCFIGGAALSYVAYKVLGTSLGTETALTICSVIAAPFLVMGWYKPYGMPFEKFFQTAFISTILAPHHRKYKTKNLFSSITDDPRPMSQSDYKKRKKKELKIAKENNKYMAYK